MQNKPNNIKSIKDLSDWTLNVSLTKSKIKFSETSGDWVKDDKTGRIAPMPKVSRSIPITVRKIK